MILSAHQPAYIPWFGYFNKIANSDVFIFLDSVQFEKNSFINRNKIKASSGLLWLTVPVKINGHMSKAILDIEIDNSQNWSQKHLNSIFLNYKKAPFFEENYAKLLRLFDNRYERLSDLCWAQLNFWITEFGIQVKILRSSDLEVNDKKSALILELCKQLAATTYISGPLGKNYLNENQFELENIKIVYQLFDHPKYNQLWGDFVDNLSIIDLWMNVEDCSLLFKKDLNEFFTGMGQTVFKQQTP